jgi:hypothetical protein
VIPAELGCKVVNKQSQRGHLHQSQSHFTADSQSVCLGVEPILWTFDLFKSLGLEFVVLSLWGALSDERPDPQKHYFFNVSGTHFMQK